MTPFFYFVTCNSYLDMLIIRLLSQVQHDSNGFVFQQDVAPCDFHMAVRNYLSAHHPWSWIVLVRAGDFVSCRWPSRSPAFNSGRHLCLPQPQRRTSPELRLRITGSWPHCAQSLERVGLRHQLLPCDMQCAHPVSVRYVRNF